VGYFRSHLLATGFLATAIGVMAAVLAFAHPASHPSVLPGPPNNDLPYAVVSYTAADARRAFATEGIRLGPRSHSASITTLGNRADILEVDAFGDPERVKASGFYDYTVINGRYVRFPRGCGSGSADAERWQGNVRVIVSCRAAGGASSRWISRVARALARL